MTPAMWQDILNLEKGIMHKIELFFIMWGRFMDVIRKKIALSQ